MKNTILPSIYNRLRRTIYLTSIISAVILSACTEVLEKTPIDSYSDAAVWDDAALIQAFANAAYKDIPFGFQNVNGWRFMPYANMTDEANSRNSASNIQIIINGNASSSYLGPMDVWTGPNDWTYWKPINQANIFLDKIQESSISEDLKSELSAEMKAVRAYAYFKFISHYGGVPLITTPFNLGDEFRVARNTYDEIMDFIVAELDEAIPDLPLDYDASNDGKVTKGAAMAIKARALLYAASPLNNPENNQQKWQAAADASKAIIDMGMYSLHDDYKALFTVEGGYNTEEIIWGRPQNINVDIEALVERLLYPNGWLGFGHSHPLQNLIDDFEMENGLNIEEEGSGYDPQDPYVNRDPRFYNTILYDGAPFKERTIETFTPGGQDSPDGFESAWNASETSYYIRKFIDESQCGCTSNEAGSSSPTWIWFRYGETLLNYAETMFMLGDEATAREYVNMVRSRPGVEMPLITESGNELWERIMQERRVELVFEEFRFFDVRRWKTATEVLSQDRMRMNVTRNLDTGEKSYSVEFFQPAQFNDWNYLAPIPQIVIDQNSLIEQNPGY
ncbi:RagB/SusD family nutrient uptake outer membrane protein [Cyclobacterium qasimii]|uniref:Membrane protein n=2 Tax=Cyclobacterium qasimii TaxID=1350429 RepID=A0A512C5U8_9BACT|nr:RagB/SusD family nutrient uptake outer membrane protein [Cyclobacterium qasimii]EPR65569.1 putative outer membrane protein [Cyclobacterium qasimii M12-11B]GEO19579.1 membrane protein [Cyclobacterium qasimii]